MASDSEEAIGRELFSAIRSSDLELIRTLVTRGVNLHRMYSYFKPGWPGQSEESLIAKATPLNFATLFGTDDVTLCLCELGRRFRPEDLPWIIRNALQRKLDKSAIRLIELASYVCVMSSPLVKMKTKILKL